MSSTDLCKICNKVEFKYTCPKCNTLYCSVDCYKSPKHQKCSEEFYKKCVEEELAAAAASKNSNEDVKKMYDILNRFVDQADPDEFEPDELQEDIDSDDNSFGDDAGGIAERLEGIDINDSDAVWKHLTDEERKDFQGLIENGEIMKILPKYKPWWSTQNSKLIIELSEENHPKICDNIPLFSTIYSKEPPPCIHNNLWNVVAAYACTVKFFNGEHHTNAWEAINYLLSLSANLRKNMNFDDAEKAVVSVEMEGLGENVPLPCEEFAEIENDSRRIMSGLTYKLAGLSDVLCLCKLAKDEQYGERSKRKTCEFVQRFNGKILEDLSKSKLNLVIKKIEFFLSYIQRDKK